LPFYARPFWVVFFLTLVVILAFAWIWRSEMQETSREFGTVVDQQRTLFDLELRASVSAIQDAGFLSTVSPSSSQFRSALEAIVVGNENIRNLRVLDRLGRELLEVRGEGSERRQADEGAVAQAEADPFEGDFVEALRSLSEGEVMISDFAVRAAEGRVEPTILLGTGLFFPSGARAGFIVAELEAHGIVENLGRLEQDDSLLFIVSSEGKWIYDQRGEDEWSSLRNSGEARWVIDEYPELWRAMVSSGDGSVAGQELWIFREHTPFETESSPRRRTLRPDSVSEGGISAESFFVVKRVSAGPSWDEIWSSLFPVFLLYGLAVLIVVPALIRFRRALGESEKSAQELADANLKTRMAMEAAGISEWRIDFDVGTIRADKRTAGMLLLKGGESLKTVEDWEERIHPQERRKVFDQLESIWADGKGTLSLRHRMRRGDGSWGWYRFRGAVRLDTVAGQKFILGAYLNVTEAVQQEAELSRLEMATEQTLSGIAILDKEGQLEWCNRAFRGMSGRGVGEMSGKPIWDLLDLSGESAAAEKESIRAAILRGDEFSLVVTHTPGGVELNWTRVVGNPVLDRGGIPTHYVVVESDISREKRAEMDLRKNESLLRESQRIAGIGSWEIDVEEDSSFWTDEIYRIFGLSEDTTADPARVLDLIDPEFRELIREDLQLAINEGCEFEREFSFHRPDGEMRWGRTTCMAIQENGVISKVYGVTQDITERKRSEADLIAAKEEEEALNDQMAAALDLAKIAEQKANEASEAKSAFLSMISHEIRNPLNGVIGMAEILRQTSLDSTQKDYLEAIHSSGSTVVMLLDDILDYNRLEHGRIEFEQLAFSVESAAEESILIFAAKMAQKGLDIGFRVDPEVPGQLTGDVTRVKQILFNLIGNAVKFTEKGSIEVEIELRERRPNDRCLLQFTVADTGIGIPESRHDRIFQSFSQVDASITRKFGGSGLGLAISRELAMRMGGDIEFESEEGQGTRFHVVLPFPAVFEKKKSEKWITGKAFGCFRSIPRSRQVQTSLEEWGATLALCEEPSAFADVLEKAEGGEWILVDSEIALEPAVKAALQKSLEKGTRLILIGWPDQNEKVPLKSQWISLPLTRQRLREALEESQKSEVADNENQEVEKTVQRGMKILVAEDNVVNQKVIRLLLKRLGYACSVVENGALALEKVKEESFDLVLMDIQMPELDGIEASQRIMEEVPGDRRPRIVALTAGATRDNREDAEAAGMSGYLTKPIQAEALEEELRQTEEFLSSR